MSWQAPPAADFDNHEQAHLYRWDYDKFEGMKQEDIFGSLHEKFNTAPMFILDKTAWYYDVAAAAREAETIEELHEKLETRRDGHLAQMKETMEGFESKLNIWYPSHGLYELALPMLKLHHNASLDSVVGMFAALDALRRNMAAEKKAKTQKAKEASKSQDAADETHPGAQRLALSELEDATSKSHEPSPTDEHITPNGDGANAERADAIGTYPTTESELTLSQLNGQSDQDEDDGSERSARRKRSISESDVHAETRHEATHRSASKRRRFENDKDQQDRQGNTQTQQIVKQNMAENAKEIEDGATSRAATKPNRSPSPGLRREELGEEQRAPIDLYFDQEGWTVDHGPSKRALPEKDTVPEEDTVPEKEAAPETEEVPEKEITPEHETVVEPEGAVIELQASQVSQPDS